jgi:DNA-binding winged helix-turn-helix (wHTH) protein
MILRGMKIGEIHNLNFDLNFFNEFPNTKMMIDRMIYQLPKQTADALNLLANNSPVEVIDRDIMCYLHKVGVIDENDKIRSQMLIEYFKLCYEPKAEKIVETSFVEKRDEENADNDANKYYQVNSKTRLHKLSGQILVGDIPSNEYLTEKELTLFIYMYSRPNQDVTRDELAKIIWTENTDAQYSDWAIDKVISRIREKLGDKKPYTLIKTTRKIGFKIVQ